MTRTRRRATAGKFFISFLLAFVLTGAGALVPNDGWPHDIRPVTQAHAAGGACGNWWDDPGVVYSDYSVASGGSFQDFWQNKITYMRADLTVYRYTTTGSDGWTAGHCLSEVKATGWVNDGSYGTDQLWYLFEYGDGTVFESGGTGYNWEGSNIKWNNGTWQSWLDVSGRGLIRGYSVYAGHNANWSYYPDNVPSAGVDIR